MELYVIFIYEEDSFERPVVETDLNTAIEKYNTLKEHDTESREYEEWDECGGKTYAVMESDRIVRLCTFNMEAPRHDTIYLYAHMEQDKRYQICGCGASFKKETMKAAFDNTRDDLNCIYKELIPASAQATEGAGSKSGSTLLGDGYAMWIARWETEHGTYGNRYDNIMLCEMAFGTDTKK